VKLVVGRDAVQDREAHRRGGGYRGGVAGAIGSRSQRKH
jgi:hypothetical protein